MLFNSVGFLIFLPIVFLLHWFFFKKSFLFQNLLLLAASWFFYACWDWRFLFLLIFSTLLDYASGLKMASSLNVKKRKIWFWLSISANIGLLGLFKYYNFFAESFALLFSKAGLHVNISTLNIILPLGISFYTFHGLSYVIDVYKKKIEPENSFIDYALFVSFFPLLVAGPIERATHLLPQLKQARIFNYGQATDGLRQILWGLFKKVVIADQCAPHVNMIFGNPDAYSGSTLFIGAVLFAIQIYGDFSGYSDIAIGTARLFGIELLRNFSYPYFSRDIAEFWRRWHISLSSWFRDYLYIPLGGSKVSTIVKVRNTFIIFIVSGFWHGANWTFIVWGLLNAFYIIPQIILNTNRNNLDVIAKEKLLPSIKELLQVIFTFTLTVFAWIFFRAENLHIAWKYIKGIFSMSFFKVPYFPVIGLTLPLAIMIVFLFATEWHQRQKAFALRSLGLTWPLTIRWGFYSFMVMLIYYYAVTGTNSEFIYFQF